MANRYWVGGTGNWDFSTRTHWGSMSGVADNASVPTSVDDVIFDTLSNATGYVCTITATATCRNLIFGNPLSGQLTLLGSSSLYIYGNFSWASGMNRAFTGAITMKATSGIKTITSNGIDFDGFFIMDGTGGTFQLADNFRNFNGSSDSFYLNAGSFDANGKTVTKSAPSVYHASALAINFYNLTIIPETPAKTNSFIVQSDLTVTNLLTISNGATVTNRVLVLSDVVGTPRTITAASVAISNTDFQDITGAGAASWNMSAASGGSGNCGGNTMKALGDTAFTTAVNQHWTSASSSSWSIASNWTSRVPLPQDDVFMDKAFGTSQTVTVDMPRLGKSINWTGATWTTALTWAISSTTSIFGSLTMINNLTMSGTSVLTFAGRSNYIFTSNSLSFNRQLQLTAPGGTLSLSGDLTLPSTRAFIVNNGELSAVNGGNNYVLSLGSFTINNDSTLTLGSATHLLTGVAASSVNTTATINAGTSTLKFIDSSNSLVSFTPGGKTYNNIWFSRGVSTGINRLFGATNNTFNDFKDDGTAAHSIQFIAGTTQTVNTFTVSGTSGNLITLNSTTTGTHSLVKSGGGVIQRNYLNIQHSVATPSNTWYAGLNSVDNQGVVTIGSGWLFDKSLTATTGNFTLSGIIINIFYGRRLITNVRTYSLIGINASLFYGRKIITAVQTYLITGTNTSLRCARKIAATTQSCVLTGINTSLKYARKCIIIVGSFTLTGINVSIKYGRKIITTTQAYSLTGIDTILKYARKIIITVQTYSLSLLDCIFTKFIPRRSGPRCSIHNMKKTTMSTISNIYPKHNVHSIAKPSMSTIDNITPKIKK